MNEVIKIVEEHIGKIFDNDSKYPDKEYGKLRDFIERLYDVESDIDNEDDAVKKMFLQTEIERMGSCTKTFRRQHVLFALRSGLNVLAER